MANNLLWTRTQQLTGEMLKQVQDLYNARFPIEVRHSVAEWLEQQNWKKVEDENDETFATYLLDQLVDEIHKKASSTYTSQEAFPHKLRLLESASTLKMTYQDNPLELVRFVRGILIREEQLVRMSLEGATPNPENQISQTERQILGDFEVLRHMISDADHTLKREQHLQENFVLSYQQKKELENKIERFQKTLATQQEESNSRQQKMSMLNHMKTEHNSIDRELYPKAGELKTLKTKMIEDLKNAFVVMTRLVNNIFDIELENWKDLQRKATFQSDLCEAHVLNKIQRWCEELAGLHTACKQMIIKVEVLDLQLPHPEPFMLPANIKTTLLKLQDELLLKSFVVDRQPPQVVRKDARFTANVRLLVGINLNVFYHNPTVEAFIINEQQAVQIQTLGSIPPKMENAGTILNCKGTMEYSQGQLAVTFRNMQLKKCRRADRKGSELVVEEKFCLLFKSNIQIGKDHEFETWAMSLPIVVTVHGNQECQAQATILWDNAFSEQRRLPFQVPDQVLWKDLALLLSCWFAHRTGAGLTHEHLLYLAAKLFGEGVLDYSNHVVTRGQFHKDPLPVQAGKNNFTFWEWLYNIQKLTKDNIRQLWVEGLVVGFISKKHAQDLLQSRPAGTFLLRFSDTEPGGISVVFNDGKVGNDGKPSVSNLAPFLEKDFRILCLADRVRDMTNVTTLYPDLPKAVAFGKYWTRDDESSSVHPGDYIRHTLSMTIPGVAKPSGMTNPLSPESCQQPMSNMTVHSMDMSELSPRTAELTSEDITDFMMSNYLQ